MRRGLDLWRPIGLCLLVIALGHPMLSIGTEMPAVEPEPAAQTPFELRVHGNQLSLVADQASVKAILAAIGRQMQIEMIVHLREDRYVTATFTGLPVQEALKRLGLSAATVIAKDQHGVARMKKIVVLDKGVALQLSPSAPASPPANLGNRHAQDDAPPERTTVPLKLDIDPSQAPRQP